MEVTIVSFLPYTVTETKPGLIPDTYTIPAAKNGKPGVLVINDARSNLYVRDGQTYPITHSAEEVANAIVNDYWVALLQTSEDARPAMFWVPGSFTVEEILFKFQSEVVAAKMNQLQWFSRLVRLADDDWERYKQHRMITDMQRHAAKELGLVTKPWMFEVTPTEMAKCPACASTIELGVAICKYCGTIIDKKRAEELGIKAA